MLAANVIFLSFKYNAAKFTGPSFCNLSGKDRCAKCSYPLLSAAFLSALSHPEGQHKHYLPSTGKGINFVDSEKYVLRRKPWTLTFSPFPPSFGESQVLCNTITDKNVCIFECLQGRRALQCSYTLQITVEPLSETRKSKE